MGYMCVYLCPNVPSHCSIMSKTYELGRRILASLVTPTPPCRIPNSMSKSPSEILILEVRGERQYGSNFEFSPEFQRKAMGVRVNNVTVDGTKLPSF